ncbi:hypothetical protein, partial [Pseudomonas gingeri]|uniref:hypothetical protein n=1 Tax=Pseudomonas gingeri TaxID=117681 RepID=UPI00210F0B08
MLRLEVERLPFKIGRDGVGRVNPVSGHWVTVCIWSAVHHAGTLAASGAHRLAAPKEHHHQ